MLRVRDVAGHQVARVRVGDLAGDPQGRPVQRFEQVFLADDPHLLAVSVVGERLDDVGAGALVVQVQRAERVGVLQRHLGDELTGGEVTPPFELEEESLGTDHRACVEAVGQWHAIVHERSPPSLVDRHYRASRPGAPGTQARARSSHAPRRPAFVAATLLAMRCTNGGPKMTALLTGPWAVDRGWWGCGLPRPRPRNRPLSRWAR